MSTITASQEQQVVDQVPKQLYIAGEWRDGAKGTFAVEDPSTAQDSLCEVADASVDDARARLTRRRRRPRVRRDGSRVSAVRSCAARLRLIIERKRRAGAADDAGDGQVGGRVTRRDHLCGRVLPLVLRGGGADRRPLRGRRQRRRPGADDEAARRALPDDHALELPAGDGHAQDRSGDRGRLHDGGQARRTDAAVDAGAGADPRGGRSARRCAQPVHGDPRRARRPVR